MDTHESLTVEYKREYVDDIKKTITAFANTSGGTLFIGVDDYGNAIGIDNIDETMLKVTSSIRDSISPDVTLFVSCKTELINDKEVLAVLVQRGTSCPYYLTNKGLKPSGVYVRQGAATVPATETAIRQMIKDTDGDKFENIRSLNQELTFTDISAVFQSTGIIFEEQQMKTLHLINEDNMYTNLALLLSEQCVHSIKVAVFEGTDKSIFKDRAEFKGSLISQVNNVYQFLDRYNRTGAVYEGLHRIDLRDYPTATIREALLNAVIHRDYSLSGSILISIFDDRIEIISIGGLVRGISYDDMLLGVSIQRNERLADVFYRLKLIEAYGTGIPRIMKSYDKNANKPVIETTDNAFKITLPNTNYVGDKVLTKSVNEVKIKGKEVQKNAVLQLLKRQDTISRLDVESALSVSQATAARILKNLVSEKVVERLGDGKNIKYRLL